MVFAFLNIQQASTNAWLEDAHARPNDSSWIVLRTEGNYRPAKRSRTKTQA
jgi:hypothetical protein